MGYLFYNHAVAFADDLELEIDHNEKDALTMDAFYKLADQKYAFTVCQLQLSIDPLIDWFLSSFPQYRQTIVG